VTTRVRQYLLACVNSDDPTGISSLANFSFQHEQTATTRQIIWRHYMADLLYELLPTNEFTSAVQA
jgi:hypothetical protein